MHVGTNHIFHWNTTSRKLQEILGIICPRTKLLQGGSSHSPCVDCLFLLAVAYAISGEASKNGNCWPLEVESPATFWSCIGLQLLNPITHRLKRQHKEPLNFMRLVAQASGVVTEQLYCRFDEHQPTPWYPWYCVYICFQTPIHKTGQDWEKTLARHVCRPVSL